MSGDNSNSDAISLRVKKRDDGTKKHLHQPVRGATQIKAPNREQIINPVGGQPMPDVTRHRAHSEQTGRSTLTVQPKSFYVGVLDASTRPTVESSTFAPNIVSKLPQYVLVLVLNQL